MKSLVIVESPAKATTIAKYLGKDFKVLSSVGHIRSIAKKAVKGKPPIDVENNFETQYEIDSDKKKTITELKKAVKQAETVWLATDEDREGEAIAWHLCEVLNLDPKQTKRIVFHEITKSAIQEAVQNPRTVDQNLVEAQQARQILDRLVGFELSPVVWKKVPGGKSAGRVQSPAVRLIVEREKEIESFESDSEYRVRAIFAHDNHDIQAELDSRFSTEEEAHDFLNSIKDATFTIKNVQVSPGKRNPPAPFTTSTLQQDANAKLGFGSRATMASAQKLYQSGKITYMRTDSVNLSGQAIASIATFVEKEYGKEYSQVRKFKTKSSSAQEAHEAIRPTDISVKAGSSDTYDQKLYDLIRNRTLASQMASAVTEKTSVDIEISNKDNIFVAKGEVIKFDGFLRVYGATTKDSDILPPLKNGMSLVYDSISAKETFSRPPARYTEGSLVKKLEELGIGRPSTYATIIGTVQARGYAERGESEGEEREAVELSLQKKASSVERTVLSEKTGSNKGKLIPTSIGRVMSDFLTDNFQQIVDYDFTAHIEEDFDKIAEDQLEKSKMLKDFYGPFHELIEKSDDIDRSKVAKAREIGKDPKTNLPILARIGRFGPMLQLGEGEGDDKPRFAPLPEGTTIENVTLEEAAEMFKLPRSVGKTSDGEEIKANIGRFGPYVQVNKEFFSIKKYGHDPLTITEKEAQTVIEEIREARKPIKVFESSGIQIVRGPYGPYLKKDKTNARIPKGTEPEDITEEQAIELIENAPKKTGKKRARRTKKK